MGSVVMMSKRKSRNQLKVAKKNCPNIKCIICVLKVPRSSLPVSPIHGRVKHKLKKSVKISEKQEEVTDPENKSKPEVETDTELSCDSLTATPRSNDEQIHEKNERFSLNINTKGQILKAWEGHPWHLEKRILWWRQSSRSQNQNQNQAAVFLDFSKFLFKFNQSINQSGPTARLSEV